MIFAIAVLESLFLQLIIIGPTIVWQDNKANRMQSRSRRFKSCASGSTDISMVGNGTFIAENPEHQTHCPRLS